MNIFLRHKNKQSGYIVMLVIVFGAVFAMILTALTGFIFTQKKVQLAKENRERAIQIAEGGLDYYKWFLSHFPDDLQDGTGGPGPYEHTYNDPEEGEIGSFSLEIGGNAECEIISSIDINSTGWTNADPTYKREVFGRYSRPSVAEYAFIIDSNVWAGADREITGRYHSNGGIRMDGTNYSTVSSAVESWLCSSSFGCDPNETQDGVFGAGSGSELWEFPVPPIDFVGISVDLANMEDVAQASGLYFGSLGGESDRHGYHVIFNGDDTMSVYKVKKTEYALSIHIDDLGGGWQRDYHTITNETLLGTYSIPPDCGLLFFKEKVWLEGTIKGKVTVASAKISSPNYDTDVVIEGNIDYTTLDGSDGLTVIAENSILIPLESPDDLSIRGIFIAQGGYFGRNLYPCWYAPDDIKNSLETHGTIVSSDRVGTRWTYSGADCGDDQLSGYTNRQNFYDRALATDPPPLTPYVSSDYRFVEWREEN